MKFISPLCIEDQDAAAHASIDEIEAKIAGLSNEMGRLQHELDSLCKERDVLYSQKPHEEASIREIVMVSNPKVSRKSSDWEKCQFFASLFRGRSDVYAVRWKNKKGAAGYSFKCGNRFNPVLCNYHCQGCRSRCYEELTSDVLKGHFMSTKEDCEGAVGLYVMKTNDTCSLIAFDFDEKDWKHEALAVLREIRSNGFDAALERSRSGNGAHIWVFFDHDIAASKARAFGLTFITLAMQKSDSVQLASYDRLFPLQDSLSKDGLGNLILLPFAGAAVKNGNTLFVDSSFEPYPDQWVFLSSLRKVGEGEIDSFLRTHREGLGGFLPPVSLSAQPSDFKLSPDEIEVHHDRPLKIGNEDFLGKGKAVLYLSTGVSIIKASFSKKALDCFRRIASFPNPNFYLMQNMRKWISPASTPRITRCFQENDNVLWLPRGCISSLESLLSAADIPFREESHRFEGHRCGFAFKGTLYPLQQKALEAILQTDNGILNAATGFGKTVVGVKYIESRDLSALILVRSKTLVDQWRKTVKSQLGLDAGIFIEGKDKRTGLIDIAMVQSLTSQKQDSIQWTAPEFLKDYGTVIYDECHHAASDTSLEILRNCPARFVLGLTATAKRQDGMQKSIFMNVGPVRFSVDAANEAAARGINQTLVCRFSPSRVPIGSEFSDSDLLTFLSKDEKRNSMIVSDICEAIGKGLSPLVLSHRVDQINSLSVSLQSKGIKTIVLHGKLSSHEKKAAYLRISELGKGEAVVLSTGKFFGEGSDVPLLDTLFLATPSSWEGVVEQYAGRIARAYEGKHMTFLYDYVDFNIPVCSRKYRKRLKVYSKLGYISKLSADSDHAAGRGLIYGKAESMDGLMADLDCASSEITVSFEKVCSTVFANKLLKLCSKAVKVRIICRSCSPELDSLASTDAGAFVNAVVIDRRIAWFGADSIDSIFSDSSVMIRLDDGKVADSFLDACEGGSLFPSLA